MDKSAVMLLAKNQNFQKMSEFQYQHVLKTTQHI